MDLSDDADDIDSFFSTVKTIQKRSSALNVTNVKTQRSPDFLDDLFGIAGDKEKENKFIGKKQSLDSTQKLPLGSMDNDDDLGFDPKKPKGVKQSQDLFTDLFRPATMNVTKNPQNVKLHTSRQSIDTTTGTDTSSVLHNPAVSLGRQNIGRRNSGMSNIYNTDPLGLLIKDKEKNEGASAQRSILSTPKQNKSTTTTVDWLGLSIEKDEQFTKVDANVESPSWPNLSKATSMPHFKNNNSKIDENSESLHDQTSNALPSEMINEQIKVDTLNQTSIPQDTMAQNILLLGTLNNDAQQSYTTLKYQEHHIIMAQQMKQQEKNLMEMQQKQERLLQKQEAQFNALLQQQLQRHQHLENIITQQQQRLNNHLQMMMTATNQTMNETVSPFDLGQLTTRITSNVTAPAEAYEITQSIVHEEKENGNENFVDSENLMNVIQIQADNKRLVLENLRLEELIANTKNNYEKEIEMLEKSHGKQVEVLEQQFHAMEQRLMKELQNVEKYYEEKFNIKKVECENLKLQYENQIGDLMQKHEDEMKKLHRNHQDDIELLKEEHHRMLNTIRQSKMLEFALVQESGTNLETLKAAANNLTNLTDGLEELRVNIQQKIDVEQMERHKQLDNREKHIEDAESRLKLTEQMAVDEKKRLMELVATLEAKLMKMSQDAAEENWQLRQKMASLDADKNVFNREKDYFREQMERDEQRLKDLKERQLLEIQKLESEMQEERGRLRTEWTKFEMEKRLYNNNNLEQERQELMAALQVTQDATRKADTERERYYKMQRQLEQLKRDLTDREHTFNIKEEELHQELLTYRTAERLAQETLQKSKYTEQYYQNKIQLVEKKMQELTEREAHLSQDRLLLSQDRIALHALKTKLTQQTKCTLCQLTRKQQDISAALESNLKALGHDNSLIVNNKLEKNNNSTLNNDLITDDKIESFISSASIMKQLYENDSNVHNTNINNENNDIVERLLDANISESLRKMHMTTYNLGGWETLLDDDHKKLVQQTND